MFIARFPLLKTCITVGVLFQPISGTPAQEPVVFSGHGGAVMMAAFASDDGRVVTVSSDQTARLWDAKTGAQLGSYVQHTGPLYCLAVSGDGRTLVTGAQDNTLRVWDLPLSKPLRSLTDAGPAIRDIAFSSDGKSLLAASADNSLRFIDPAAKPAPGTTAVPSSLRAGHLIEPLSAAFRNDGVCFASADAAGVIRLWSPDFETPLGKLQAHSGKISALLFPNSNQQLVSAGDDGAVRVWQLMPTLPKLVTTLDEAGLSLSVIAGQPLAICASRSGTCRLINLQTGEVVREYPRMETPLTDVALSPNAAWLTMSTSDGRSRLLNFNDAAVLGTVAGHEGPITDAAVHPDSLRFLTTGLDGTARFWKQPVAPTPMPGHSAPIRGLASATNGQWSATISDDLTPRIWNATGGALLALGNHTQPLRALAIRDDDALLATGDAEGTVWIWNPVNGAAEGVVTAHAAAITAVAFSADRSSLITSGADGFIRSWTLPLPKQKPATGEEPPKPAWEFKSPDGTAVTQLARLSQDQGLLALTATGTQVLRLKWDGSAIADIASPGGALRSLDVAPSGMSFLATSDSGQIHVFATDGVLQKSLPPIAGLTSARFDRDGKLLAVSDGQPRVRIVAIETGRVQEELATPFPVVEADWTAVDQRSVTAVGTGNDGVLVQRSLLRIWEDVANGATSAALTPNQQFALCGGGDGKIRQWNLSDGSLVRTFEGHTGAVAEVAMSPNSQWVCSAGADKTFRIWAADDGALKHTMEHPQPVRSVSVSADSTRAATACADGIVRIWDVTTGRLLESFAEHVAATAVSSVRYQNDGLTLVSIGDDKTVQTMRTSILRSWPVHTGSIRSMTGYNGGAQVITAGADGRVVMTNVSSGSEERVYVTGDRRPTVVATRVDNQRLAAGCESGEVLIWNSGDGTQTIQVLNVGTAVNSIGWSPDNRKLIVSTVANTVHVFGPSLPNVQPATELVLQQQFNTEATVSRALFAPDNRSVLLAMENGRIEEWAYAGLEQRWKFNHGGPVCGVAASRDGATVVSASADQTVRVWDTTTGQQKFQLNGHQGAVHAVAMSPDETFAVSSGADGTLRLWDIVGGRQLKQLITFDATMYSIAMHPQGLLIAAAGADRKVHLLDMITGIEQRTLAGHTDYIHCVAFSPGGDQLLSYGYAGQLKFWNTADGGLLYETRIGRVGNYAQFAPDGRRIVIANGDGTARIVPLP